jgi:hypothetical protein
MKKIIAALACLVATLALGLLIAQATGAEATRPGDHSASCRGDACLAPTTSDGAPTLTPSPTDCPLTYTYTVLSGSPVTATNLLTGSQCNHCIVPVDLPFPFTYYGQTYNSVNIASQGNLQFTTAYTTASSCPFPYPLLGPAVMPYWQDYVNTYWSGLGDPCLMYLGQACGVYTSTSGTAPDRIFNVQWLGVFAGSNHELVNFEARLYETSGITDFTYGFGIWYGAVIGVQNGAAQFTTYSCNVSNIYNNLLIRWLPPSPVCAPTYTPTRTPSPTATSTPTPTSTPTSTRTITPTTTPVLPERTSTPTLTHGVPTATETAAATRTATPIATSCPVQFSDVPEGSTFYPYVRCLACRRIVSGYADNTFRPNNNVTRGQLSKIVSNSAGFNEPQTAQLFEDVPPGSTFFDYIGRLASRGYMSGYPCGGAGEPCVPPGNRPYFRPNNNATRGQIAKIDSNAAGFTDLPTGQTFEDMPPGSTFYTYTERLVARLIMQGYTCGGTGEPCVPPGNRPYFRPNNNATRGQTAKIVSNTFFPSCQTPIDRYLSDWL